MKSRTTQPGQGGRSGSGWWAALLCAALVSAACGSSAPKADLEAEASRQETPSSAPTTAEPSADNTPTTSPATEASSGAEQTGSSPATAVAPSAAPAPAGASAKRAPSAKGATTAAPAGASAASPAPRAPAAGSAGAAPAPPKPGPAPAAPAPVPGEKGEIVLASVGTESGVIGAATRPIHQAARAFVADANARGGLAGHKLRLVIADDEGDPNKALSLARRMIDQDKAVAFFGEHGPTTTQAILPLLEERKIPSIAPCVCADANARSPMAFYAGPGGDLGMTWTHVAGLKTFAPQVKKVSVIFCREAAICLNVRNRINEFKGKFGLEVVHEAQPSLAQPDFTAEVLAARNAGAEALVVVMENASNIRIARAAHRQNWKPVITTQGTGAETRLLTDGGADIEGLLAGSFGLYWESPKMADYVAAMKRHVPGAVLAGFGTQVWAGGKLLEKVAQSLPANPTSGDVLNALYALKGETLGGLVPPTTFLPGKPSDNNPCAVPVKVEKGKFVTAKGDEYVCMPGWQPLAK